MVNPALSMTDEELLKAIKPLMVHDSWKFFIELIKRKQSSQIKMGMTLTEPPEIYRAQGRAHAYDAVLALR